MKFGEFVDAMVDALEADPTLGQLEVFSTDDQCAHTRLSGFVFRETVEEWPTEYCIDNDLPEGATEFVRLS